MKRFSILRITFLLYVSTLLFLNTFVSFQVVQARPWYERLRLSRICPCIFRNRARADVSSETSPSVTFSSNKNTSRIPSYVPTDSISNKAAAEAVLNESNSEAGEKTTFPPIFRKPVERLKEGKSFNEKGENLANKSNDFVEATRGKGVSRSAEDISNCAGLSSKTEISSVSSERVLNQDDLSIVQTPHLSRSTAVSSINSYTLQDIDDGIASAKISLLSSNGHYTVSEISSASIISQFTFETRNSSTNQSNGHSPGKSASSLMEDVSKPEEPSSSKTKDASSDENNGHSPGRNASSSMEDVSKPEEPSSFQTEDASSYKNNGHSPRRRAFSSMENVSIWEEPSSSQMQEASSQTEDAPSEAEDASSDENNGYSPGRSAFSSVENLSESDDTFVRVTISPSNSNSCLASNGSFLESDDSSLSNKSLIAEKKSPSAPASTSDYVSSSLSDSSWEEDLFSQSSLASGYLSHDETTPLIINRLPSLRDWIRSQSRFSRLRAIPVSRSNNLSLDVISNWRDPSPPMSGAFTAEDFPYFSLSDVMPGQNGYVPELENSSLPGSSSDLAPRSPGQLANDYLSSLHSFPYDADAIINNEEYLESTVNNLYHAFVNISSTLPIVSGIGNGLHGVHYTEAAHHNPENDSSQMNDEPPFLISTSSPSTPYENLFLPGDTPSLPSSIFSLPDQTSPMPNNAPPMPSNTFTLPEQTSPMPNNAPPVPSSTFTVPDQTSPMPNNVFPLPSNNTFSLSYTPPPIPSNTPLSPDGYSNLPNGGPNLYSWLPNVRNGYANGARGRFSRAHSTSSEDEHDYCADRNRAKRRLQMVHDAVDREEREMLFPEDEYDDSILPGFSQHFGHFEPQNIFTYIIHSRSTEEFFEIIENTPVEFKGGFVGTVDESVDPFIFTIVDPKGKAIFSKQSLEGIFHVVAQSPGTYSLIIDNKRSRADRTITIATAVGNESKTSVGHVTTVEDNANILEGRIREIAGTSQLLWVHQRGHLKSAQKIFRNVYVLNLLELLFFVIVSVFQIYYLQSLVSDRRIL